MRVEIVQYVYGYKRCRDIAKYLYVMSIHAVHQRINEINMSVTHICIVKLISFCHCVDIKVR